MPLVPASDMPAAKVRSAELPLASTAPSGLEAAAPNPLEQAWTASKGGASGSVAPIKDSEPHEAGSMGASKRSEGPPQASSAPLGGSELHKVGSVGAITQAGNPLHGVKLEAVVTALVESYGWQELGQRINIRCFTSDPSIPSSLKFLRKTPWARDKVESLYLFMRREARRAAPPVHNFPPPRNALAADQAGIADCTAKAAQAGDAEPA